MEQKSCKWILQKVGVLPSRIHSEMCLKNFIFLQKNTRLGSPRDAGGCFKLGGSFFQSGPGPAVQWRHLAPKTGRRAHLLHQNITYIFYRAMPRRSLNVCFSIHTEHILWLEEAMIWWRHRKGPICLVCVCLCVLCQGTLKQMEGHTVLGVGCVSRHS